MIKTLVKLVGGGGAVGVGLKLLSLILLYPESFPPLPNLVDVAVILVVGCYVVASSFKR